MLGPSCPSLVLVCTQMRSYGLSRSEGSLGHAAGVLLLAVEKSVSCCHWWRYLEERRRARDPAPHVTAARYRLQTLAGPLTSRTMDNGFVMMSLMLVPSGNDLLGEQEPADSEPVSVSAADEGAALTTACSTWWTSALDGNLGVGVCGLMGVDAPCLGWLGLLGELAASQEGGGSSIR